MFSMFARKPPACPREPTDEVVPLPFFDDTLLLASSIHTMMYVFDKVLDPEKLEDAIERLAQRPDWRKISARIRRNERGGLEFHIPTKISKTRPLITRTRLRFESSIAGHPIARRIPKPSAKPAVMGIAEDLGILFSEEVIPQKLDDYLYQDRSVIGIHIVSFRDATIIITHSNHCAMDGSGRRAIFDAWILMLKGKEDHILSPVDYHEDPLTELGKNTSVSHKLSSRKLSTFGIMGWALNNIVDMAIRRPETRLMCLPAGFVEKLRSAALNELANTQIGAEKPFVSDGDIIVAWLAKLGVCHLQPASNRNVTLATVFDCRKALTGSFLPPGRPILSNCVAFFNTLLPVKDVIGKPLSHTAQHVRTALQEQTDRDQIEAYFTMVRAAAPKKLPPMFGDTSMQFICVSNWCKAGFFGLDFSAACVTKCEQPVRPTYIQAVQSPPKFLEMYIIIGKDSLGNYWLSGCRTEQAWAVVRNAFEHGDYLFENR